jgi:3-oxoacyl-[acyl-carrier-protein] synthase II
MTMTPKVMITAWSAVSPFGMSRASFVDGVTGGHSAAVDLDQARWNAPDKRACLVPGFDIKTVLGRKGTRAMNRVTALAVTTVGQLIQAEDPGRAWGRDTAIVLGTTTGSSQSNMDVTRDSLTGARPFDVEPARLPYCVMNCAAGQCAIWYGLQGPNATIASGRPTGLAALSYARRLLVTGRATRVMCGATEEYSTARAWINFHASGRESLLGEGCAMFVLELAPSVPPGTRPLGSVLAVESRVCLDGDWRGAVARCVERVTSAVPGAAPVSAACPSGADDAGGEAERAVLGEAFGAGTPVLDVTGLIGETHAASAAFQLARVLSQPVAAAAPDGGTAVVTSTDPGGAVSAALIQLGGSQ